MARAIAPTFPNSSVLDWALQLLNLQAAASQSLTGGELDGTSAIEIPAKQLLPTWVSRQFACHHRVRSPTSFI